MRLWKRFLCGALLLAPEVSMSAGGPISKFDGKPHLALRSEKSAADLERCLIDLPNFQAPSIYRQPDRPTDVTIIWKGGDVSVARIDLKQTAEATLISAWLEQRAFEQCL